jgi:predicted CXXCH cytochrome family protein
MTCTSCHDPHSSPDPASKVSYFRAKCIACHGAAFAQKHHPENPNCVACHMPALSTRDISHTQATDHRIMKRPNSVVATENSAVTLRLEPFPNSTRTQNDARDLGLAYETLVERGTRTAAPEARRLLELANKQDANDAAVLTALGYIAQQEGDTEKARQWYERAIANDPNAEEAATNLGVAEAREGHLQRAVSLWQNVFQHAPWRSSVGIDIALGYCAAGRYDRATEYVKRVLEFSPDFAIGRSLLNQLSSNPPRCLLQP